MKVDWFTVVAQVLNFLILVWLMKRFLYKPILRAIDAREKRIAGELAEADARKAEAREERDAFRRKNEELAQHRASLWKKAEDDADAERRRLLEEARQEADAMRARRLETLRRDARDLHDAVGIRVRDEVFAIARKALADLSGTSLEERMGEVFIRRLREMDGPAKTDLAQALTTASEPARIVSAFALPAEQCAAIRKALNETFSADLPVRFETDPDLVSGIALAVNGRRVGWSIADYLASVEKGVQDLLQEKEKKTSHAAAEPTPDGPRGMEGA